MSQLAISRRRFLIVHCAIVVIGGGSLLHIALAREQWPFSHYPMYASVRGPEFQRTRFYGVTEEGAEHPINVREYLRPFDDARLSLALKRLSDRPNGEELLSQALEETLDLYEKRRLAGEHDGPRLKGIAAYRLRWQLRPDLSNLEEPEQKVLLMAWEDNR